MGFAQTGRFHIFRIPERAEASERQKCHKNTTTDL